MSKRLKTILSFFLLALIGITIDWMTEAPHLAQVVDVFELKHPEYSVIRGASVIHTSPRKSTVLIQFIDPVSNKEFYQVVTVSKSFFGSFKIAEQKKLIAEPKDGVYKN